MGSFKRYKVIDNFLSKEEHQKIYDVMLSKDFPWFYMPDMSFEEIESKNSLFYMIHLFYYRDKPNSNFFNILPNLLNKLKIKSLIKVKGNFYPNQGIKDINEMHRDFSFKHKGAIYCVNTNNGGTKLEDGTIIDSVATRLLLFDPSTLHDSINCSNKKARINININYF